MGAIGDCCCCELTLETLPDWQIEGFEVTKDWNTDRTGTNSCCWEREYTVIGDYGKGLSVSPDIVRFWMNETSRTDAKARRDPLGWVWHGFNNPPGLPPGSLCREDDGLIGYATSDCTFEHKRRGYLYYQPVRILLILSQGKDVCNEENPSGNIYTLSVRTFFRTYSGIQTFFRSCTKSNFYVTHPCFELSRPAYAESGCESSNVDYAALTPAENWVSYDEETFVVVFKQFYEIPETLTVNSHVSDLTSEEYLDCINVNTINCHPFGPGVPAGYRLCYDFDETNTEDIGDGTPYINLITFSQVFCPVHGDCTAPGFGYIFPTVILCTDSINVTTFTVPLSAPPWCPPLVWKEWRLAPGTTNNTLCIIQGGDPRLSQTWYRNKNSGGQFSCCTEGAPCPSDGTYNGGPVAVDPNGNPILPSGYVEGWFGGVYCVVPGKWSVEQYSVDSEYLPLTKRTLCVPEYNFLLEVL
jgi:hypothetical protein